jgi:hypothetical protein
MRWVALAVLLVGGVVLGDPGCLGVDCACVTVDSVNVRAQASEGSRLLGVLYRGDCVRAEEIFESRRGVDYRDNEWTRGEGAYVHGQSGYSHWVRVWVLFEGRVVNGWIAADYVEIDRCAAAVIEYTGYDCDVA